FASTGNLGGLPKPIVRIAPASIISQPGSAGRPGVNKYALCISRCFDCVIMEASEDPHWLAAACVQTVRTRRDRQHRSPGSRPANGTYSSDCDVPGWCAAQFPGGWLAGVDQILPGPILLQ